MDRLTVEQAAVISAYTGFLIGDFSAMHAYVEKIMGRQVTNLVAKSKKLAGRKFATTRADAITAGRRHVHLLRVERVDSTNT